MLGVLRRNKNSPVITVLLGLTALLMIGFGMNFQGGPGSLEAATVNGEVITDQEYSARYAQQYRMRQQSNRSYTRENAKRDKLRESVLNDMVGVKLLAQHAREKSFAVDDEALKQLILKNEVFHRDGRFSKDQYERVLNSNQLTDRAFEAQERERVLASLYLTLFFQGMSISEAELKEAFEKERTKVNLEFIKIDKSAFAAQVGTVTEADAKEWVKANKDADDKIKAYYKRNKSTKYDVPKKVCARHVLARFTKGGPPDLKKKAQQKIKNAGDAIKKGVDFAQVAKKFSDDTSNKEKGGDLGCFGRGQMIPRFEEVAFGSKVDEVSTVIETPFGYHILKVYDIKDPVRIKLEDARDEITKELAKEVRASKMAKKRADEVYQLAKSKETLATAIEEANKAGTPPVLKLEETGPFPKGRDFLPRLGMAKEVAKAAWTLTKESPLSSAPIETDRAFVIIKLKEKTVPKEEEFKQARPSLMYSLSSQKLQNVKEAWYEHLKTKAEVLINPIAISYDDQARANARGGR